MSDPEGNFFPCIYMPTDKFLAFALLYLYPKVHVDKGGKKNFYSSYPFVRFIFSPLQFQHRFVVFLLLLMCCVLRFECVCLIFYTPAS